MRTFFIISLLLGVLELHHTKSRSQQPWQQRGSPRYAQSFTCYFHIFSRDKGLRTCKTNKENRFDVHYRPPPLEKGQMTWIRGVREKTSFSAGETKLDTGPVRCSMMQYYSAQIYIFNYIGLLNLLGNFLEWSFLLWRITLFIFLQWVMFPRIVLQ